LKLAKIDSHEYQEAMLTLHISFINSCIARGRSRAAKGHRMIRLAGGALEWLEFLSRKHIKKQAPTNTATADIYTLQE
jgi:hypothetical protein